MHCRVLLLTAVWLSNDGRDVGGWTSQMTFAVHYYFENLMTRDSIFVV